MRSRYISCGSACAGTLSLFLFASGARPLPQDTDRSEARAEEVRFRGGAEGVELAGTLVIPAAATASSPAPAVVLVTGSGAQDRDETVAGKKPFRVLAEGLAARGYAVLRYDDRGTKALKKGQSTGSFEGSTTADFAEDAAAAIVFLAAREEVDAERVTVCGHSTGGLVTAHLLATKRVPHAAVIVAGPAVRGGELLMRQQAAILDATHALGRSRMSDAQVASLHELQSAFVQALLDEDDDAARTAGRKLINLQAGVQLGLPEFEMPPKRLDALVEQTIEPMQGKWMHYFLHYDPRPDLAKAEVPVFALYGGRDLQVLPAQNAQPMTDALLTAGDPRSRVVTFPIHNHLFQPAETGLLEEYGQLDDDLDAQVVDTIATWLERL